MRIFSRRIFVHLTLLVVTIPFALHAADKPAAPKVDESLAAAIPLLASPDKAKRLAATQALFQQGKPALEALAKAGARHAAETPTGVDGTRRMDMVYTLIVGIPEKPTLDFARASFGLHVEKGVTREAVVDMGKKYGFVPDEFRADGRPNCYVLLTAGNRLDAVMRNLLLNEPDVVTLNLNYIER